MEGKFSHIKIIFLPKNTTSRLQPLDAGIIRNFKVKYRKSLVKYVLSRINDNVSASDIIKDVNILMAIRWVQRAWKDVLPSTMKHCFEKCGFRKSDADLIEEDDEEDPEFSALVQELCPDLSAGEYVDFDENVSTAEPSFVTDTLGWRQEARIECINRVKNPEPVSEEVVLEENDDDEETESGKRSFPNIVETLAMLDRICQCPALDNQTLETLDGVTQSLQTLRLQRKKQQSIKDHF